MRWLCCVILSAISASSWAENYTIEFLRLQNQAGLQRVARVNFDCDLIRDGRPIGAFHVELDEKRWRQEYWKFDLSKPANEQKKTPPELLIRNEKYIVYASPASASVDLFEIGADGHPCSDGTQMLGHRYTTPVKNLQQMFSA